MKNESYLVRLNIIVFFVDVSRLLSLLLSPRRHDAPGKRKIEVGPRFCLASIFFTFLVHLPHARGLNANTVCFS